MMAKILLCAALCLTLSQVSLARPDQEIFRLPESDVSNDATTYAQTCKESLNLILSQYNKLLKLSDQVKAELSRAWQKAKQCRQGDAVIKCLQFTLMESLENFKFIRSAYEEALYLLRDSVYDAIKTCTGKGFLQLIQQFMPYGIEYMY